MKKILTGLAIVSSLAFSATGICPYNVNENAIKQLIEAKENMEKLHIKEAELNFLEAKKILEGISNSFHCSNYYLINKINIKMIEIRGN